MNILPRKVDIDREKNLERKKEIDSGIALATKIDKLRETSANEEKSLNEWRENSIKLVQTEIDELISNKERLLRENKDSEDYRKKLLEPLDNEWIEINKEKESIAKDKEFINILEGSLNQQAELIKEKLKKASLTVERTKQMEISVDTLKKSVEKIKESIEKEYQLAHSERVAQTQEHEEILSEVKLERDSYENGKRIYEIHERELKEREADLIIREQHLESQQRQLRVAKEILKK